MAMSVSNGIARNSCEAILAINNCWPYSSGRKRVVLAAITVSEQ